MKAIESARLTVFARARALLGWGQTNFEGPLAPALLGNDMDTALSGSGLVITPAQDLAFFARSSAWRCTSCGKVHSFDERVAVVFASPCACAGIEFEPHRSGEVLASISAGDSVPALLAV